MKTAFITFFGLLGLLQYGVLLSAWSAYRSDARPVALKYWSFALGLSATSYLIFGLALATSEELLNNSNSLITIGNTLVFGSVLFQSLFARTLREDISSMVIRVMVGLIFAYGIIFEAIRHHGSFESRTALVGILIFLIYVWQIVEIIKARRINNATNLKVLLGIVLIESIFILARSIVVYLADANVQVLSQIPPAASLLLWVQLTLNILAYITMIGYWVEDTTAKNIRSEYENTKIKALLDEKDQLLKGLIKTKKMAEMGALSASISHEINQPLAAIKLNAWSLKRTHEQDDNLSELQLSLIEQTVRDIDRVASIVDTLRSVFKSKDTQATTFGLSDFVDRLKPLIEAELGARSIRLDYDIPTTLNVYFNQSELTLVLLNLVNNAAKAGAKTIRISAIANGRTVNLSVADDGIGIATDALSSLFELSKETEGGGLGLGLWLSKYIVERSCGTITYTANSPKGSIFSVGMPMAS